MRLEKIIIYNKNLTAGASFEELLKIIKNKYSKSELSFLGWLKQTNVHVIEIDNVKYRVFHFQDKIELRETRSKDIHISKYPAKLEAHQRYNKVFKKSE